MLKRGDGGMRCAAMMDIKVDHQDALMETPSLGAPPREGGPTASSENGVEDGTYRAQLRQSTLEDAPSSRTSRSPSFDAARALGWVSAGLGLAALLAPGPLGRLIGMPRQTGLLRLVGLRELGSAAGLLTQNEPKPWLWSRVAGDAMDLGVIGTALRQTNPGRDRAMGALIAVAAITAIDVVASLRESSRRSDAPARARVSEPLIEHTVAVNKSPQECYEFWRDLSNLPKFSPMLESVTKLDERRSHWILRGPLGARIEWDSEMTTDRPGERIAWHSLEGSDLQHSGVVSFTRAPGGRGSYVTVAMHYRASAGRIKGALAKLLGKDPNHEVREDLRRFKSAIETGEVPTTRGQPSGRRSTFGRMTRDGRESREGAVS
jgi:uncharacterized membrane protein